MNNVVVDIIKEVLENKGFKKQKSFWVMETDELEKCVQIQKSDFGNQYYLNYAFIIKNLELNNLVFHVYKRIGGNKLISQEHVRELFDTESSIGNLKRKSELIELIEDQIISLFDRINSENDLKNEIKSWGNLNEVPLIVKQRFELD